MFIYLLKSVLPWQGFKTENKEEKFDKVLEKKRNTSLE
jgi:casein kinase 1